MGHAQWSIITLTNLARCYLLTCSFGVFTQPIDWRDQCFHCSYVDHWNKSRYADSASTTLTHGGSFFPLERLPKFLPVQNWNNSKCWVINHFDQKPICQAHGTKRIGMWFSINKLQTVFNTTVSKSEAIWPQAMGIKRFQTSPTTDTLRIPICSQCGIADGFANYILKDFYSISQLVVQIIFSGRQLFRLAGNWKYHRQLG